LGSTKIFVRPNAHGALRKYIPIGLDPLPAPGLIDALRIRRIRCLITFNFVNCTARLTSLLSRNPAGIPGAFTRRFCSAYVIQTAMAGISDTCPVGCNLSGHLITPAGIASRHRRSAFCHAPLRNTVSPVNGVQRVSDGTVLCVNFILFRMSINNGNSILGTVNRPAGIRNDSVEK
jgi:hypothetical protein